MRKKTVKLGLNGRNPWLGPILYLIIIWYIYVIKKGWTQPETLDFQYHFFEFPGTGSLSGLDDQVELHVGRSAVVEIKGNKKVLLAPRRDVLHNPHHPSHVMELDWVYPLSKLY